MTIAQQLNVKDFPFFIKDSKGNCIYWEDSRGYWSKREYDNKEIYWEDSRGYWSKREYDLNNNEIYWENSYGIIIDNRPKQSIELTMGDIAAKFNIDISQLKIKK